MFSHGLGGIIDFRDNPKLGDGNRLTYLRNLSIINFRDNPKLGDGITTVTLRASSSFFANFRDNPKLGDGIRRHLEIALLDTQFQR